MSPKLAIAALTLAWSAIPSVARSSNLITPEEDARRACRAACARAKRPPSPSCDRVGAPNISKPVQNPVTIEVRFILIRGPAIDVQPSERATVGFVSSTSRCWSTPQSGPTVWWLKMWTCRRVITG